TPEQAQEIMKIVGQHKEALAGGNEMQKRLAPNINGKRVANVLNETQRATWEQLSGVPALAQAAPPSPSGGSPAAPGGSTGGANVTRAAGAVSELTVGEGGKLKFNFKFAPWKDVVEFFAKQAGYSLTA